MRNNVITSCIRFGYELTSRSVHSAQRLELSLSLGNDPLVHEPSLQCALQFPACRCGGRRCNWIESVLLYPGRTCFLSGTAMAPHDHIRHHFHALHVLIVWMASDSAFCYREFGDECKSHLVVVAYGSAELEVAETVTEFEHTVEVLGNGCDMICERDGRTGWDSLCDDRWDREKGAFDGLGAFDDRTHLHFSFARIVLLDQTLDVFEDAEIGRRVSLCLLFRIKLEIRLL